MLTSSRLRLIGERVELLLMCSYNEPRFRGIRGIDHGYREGGNAGRGPGGLAVLYDLNWTGKGRGAALTGGGVGDDRQCSNIVQ